MHTYVHVSRGQCTFAAGSHLCVLMYRRELTELREELDEEKMKRVALQVTPISPVHC